MDKKEQTIIEHLTEFRRRFLAVVACFFVFFLVSLLLRGFSGWLALFSRYLSMADQ